MDLPKIVIDAIDNGEDIFNNEDKLTKDLIHDSIIYAQRDHLRNERMSDDELSRDIKKAFKCISIKNEDGEFICVLIGHGHKDIEEKQYSYFWFVWHKKDDEWEFYNFTPEEEVNQRNSKLCACRL